MLEQRSRPTAYKQVI